MIHTCARCGKEFTGRKKKYCSEDCSKEAIRTRNRERWRKTNPPKQSVTIKCEWCGNKHTVPPRTAHQARFCSDNCKHNWRNRIVNGCKPVKDYNKERKQQKMIRQSRIEKEKLERLVEKDCAWCGVTFKTTTVKRMTCSSECSRKRMNRIKWERKESRLNESNIIDTDITLIKLYKKDKGMCYICNQPCDYDDKQTTREGYFIAGETYPSVDHVIPIAKGGKHSWDNVKLAHHRCNGIKSDRIIKDNKTLV